jgi:hypothetical protein
MDDQSKNSETGIGGFAKAIGVGILALAAYAGHGVSKFFRPAEKSVVQAIEHSGGGAKSVLRAVEKPAVEAVEHSGSRIAREASQAVRGVESPGARRAAEEFSHSTTSRIYTGVVVSSAEALSQSERIGRKLTGLKLRIPPQVYVRLLQQWHRNHAEIIECNEKLQDSTLDSSERENIQERLVAATQKNEEIEKDMQQWG